MKVSAVIPTRNREHSVMRLCKNLQEQTVALSEIIIVDSSDDKEYKDRLIESFPDLPLVWIDSSPSVCIQRNKGIAKATSSWIFLCDDDIEMPVDYMEKLTEFTHKNPDSGAVSGLWLNLERGQWQDQYKVKSFKDLSWRFIFQLSVWGDLDSDKSPTLFRPFFVMMRKWYAQRANSNSLAGWPLITNWEGEFFKTRFYSLGASLVKKEWLLQSPYDEVLDASGLGDNYGVAIRFPKSIHILTTTHIHHHKAAENRLAGKTAYYRRVLALHYFIKLNKNSNASTLWLIWSLIGNALYYLGKRDKALLMATVKAVMLMITGKNPYWIGHQKDERVIQPVC